VNIAAKEEAVMAKCTFWKVKAVYCSGVTFH